MLDEVGEHFGELRSRMGQVAKQEGQTLSRYTSDTDRHFTDNDAPLAALQASEISILGATSYVWAREEFEGAVDVLVVDEASQISMADVLAASRAAGSLILLGDPLQLSHPSQGSHPPFVPMSALQHVLGQDRTMPPDRGLFLPTTRRMHPSITEFTSDVFYDGKLQGLPELVNQEVLCDGRFAGAGLRVMDVEHEGNANASPEEAEAVVEIVQELVGCRWRNKEGEEAAIGESDVLIVTPFNAQLREITQALDQAGHGGVRVGTVDKFQGQQAPVVIYSMASSTAEDAPRGMAFLYNLNRLNVATSRAKCVAILVASPDLARVVARTPRQMELTNAMCSLKERVGEA